MVPYEEIRAFAFDVDGVFTDGGILCDLSGELYRTFDAKDGFAVRMAVMNGFPVGVVTGGRSKSITERFKTCGVPEEDVFLGSRRKTEELEAFCARHGITPSQVLFIGDDIPDIPALKLCGIAMCPSDAIDEVKDVCDIISPFPGGRRCVRHAIETTMKSQDKWRFDTIVYKTMF